jgi:hypothetical protein
LIEFQIGEAYHCRSGNGVVVEVVVDVNGVAWLIALDVSRD